MTQRSSRRARNTACGVSARFRRPGRNFGSLRLDEITPQACKEWAAKLGKEIACHYYNNTIGTLKQVLQTGIKAHKAKGGGALENPGCGTKDASG